MNEKIAENLKRIQGRIVQACLKKNRDPNEVRLIAVTKTVDIEVIGDLLAMGQRDIGESRAQQFIQRHEALGQTPSSARCLDPSCRPADEPRPRPCWHMIGHLQRNKVKALLPVVDYIHSVDSLRLAEEINTSAARLGLEQKVNVFLQVNTSQEKQKTGLAVGAVSALTEQVATLPNLSIVGLMTMAPLTEDQRISRFCFARLAEIFEDIRGQKIAGAHFQHLSMGMSQDYVTAVEEGATFLRIGTALFE